MIIRYVIQQHAIPVRMDFVYQVVIFMLANNVMEVVDAHQAVMLVSCVTAQEAA